MVCDGHTNTRRQYVPRILQPISLTYNIRHGALCLLRVHALYGRSRRILGLLLFLGTGSIVTALVGRLRLALRSVYACLNYLSRHHYFQVVKPGAKRSQLCPLL